MTALDEIAAGILAHHREAGTAEAESARRLVADHLTALGYRVSRQQFRFHPSALLGFPVLGAGVGAAGFARAPAPHVAGRRRAGAPLAGVEPDPRGIGISRGAGLAAGWLTLGEAREDANLIAVRGDAPPRRWIVAHLDTKAQAQSMAGRLVAVWVLLAALGSQRRAGRWRG